MKQNWELLTFSSLAVKSYTLFVRDLLLPLFLLRRTPIETSVLATLLKKPLVDAVGCAIVWLLLL